MDGGKFFDYMGLPGADPGKGGRILLLLPGYKGKGKVSSFIALRGRSAVQETA